MATQPATGEVHAFPGTPPMPAVARILSRFTRHQLEAFLAVALDLLDTMDGDPDYENATDLEDDFALSSQATGYAARWPGDMTAEADEQDDPGEDDDADEDEGHRELSEQPALMT